MDGTEMEAIKGRALDLWVDDLRHDRRPQMLPELDQLTDEEIEEVMELARWYKATYYSAQLDQGALDGLRSSALSKLSQERVQERKAADELAAGAANFSAALQAARFQRGVSLQTLEQTLGVLKGTLQELESGQRPPHKVALPKMLLLLQSLHLNSKRVVALIREASLAWAERVFSQPQMQLGRVDPTATDEERVQLLRGESSGGQDGLAAEIERIETYCQNLTAKVS